jgi:hypothetical protein
MVRLTVESPPGSSLAAAAVSLFAPFTSIVYKKDHNRIIPCVGEVCHEPIRENARLEEFIRNQVKGKK